MSEASNLFENSRIVYSHIVNTPGSHLRGISRDLNMHLSTLRYHIDYLEKRELIESRKENNTRVYFAAGRLDALDKSMAPLLRQKRFRDVVLLIAYDPGLTHSEISARLSLKPSTLSKYLAVLEERGMVSHEQAGREKRYQIVEERKVVEFLLRYKKSFWDPFVDNVLEIYFER
jgi:predicted transcriptional regulator